MPQSTAVPVFPGVACKNDALFQFGATQDLPFVSSYDQAAPEVVCGPSCKMDLEVLSGQCAADGVPIVHRRGGGGVVVLLPGMVVTVVVGLRSREEPITGIFSRVHRAMIALLQPHVAEPIVERGISDLAIGDRKILGSSLYLPHGPFVFCYQSSLMVDCDVSLLPRYLAHPRKEPGYRAGRSHRDFCTTLACRGSALTPVQAASLLHGRLASTMAG